VNPAVVVDVGWVNGLAAIRSLGRAGIRVLALDHRPSALGFRSRYAEPVVTPDPQDEEAFVSFLEGLDVGEIVANGCRNVGLGQQCEQAKPCVVVVMSGG